MNKKVLIICDLFPPAFGPRMGYLVKYLTAFGWDSVVITEKIKDSTYSFMIDAGKTHDIDFYKNNRFKKIKWLFVFLSDLFFKYKSRIVYREAIRILKKDSFDLILCSSYRTFPLPAALMTARKAGLPLVTDLRDIIEQYPRNEFFTSYIPPIPIIKDWFIALFKKLSIQERNRVLKASDWVTTVSEWHKQLLCQYNPNVSLIYNGFDPELFYPAPTPASQFLITYTGRLHSLEMQDPCLFFKAVKRLTDDKIITPERCRLVWYVDAHSAELLKVQGKKYGLDEYMDIRNYVPAECIPKILNRSSILLLLTNVAGEKGPNGIMGTKTFEYLAVQKPILCVRSDEDCLEKFMQETNAGLAARREEEVYDFIKNYLERWEKEGFTQSDTGNDQLVRYSRKEQALQFIRIFEGVLSQRNG